MSDAIGLIAQAHRPPSRGLTGHLRLTADLDSLGETRLRRQSFCAPFHLSKPHRDAGVLVVNVANPTAGLLEGDRLELDVRVEPGARLLLTTPSASRVHTMPGPGHAEVTQSFRVAAGGDLDYWPEMLIPQRGSRYRQRTTLELEAGAELLFFEMIAPGRVAAGEVFTYADLRWATDLRVAGRQLVRERCCLVPDGGPPMGLNGKFPAAYYASALLASPRLAERSGCWENLLALQSDEIWSGVSSLGGGAFAWKIVTASSLALRRALTAGRAMLYQELGRTLPSLRRAGVPHGG